MKPMTGKINRIEANLLGYGEGSRDRRTLKLNEVIGCCNQLMEENKELKESMEVLKLRVAVLEEFLNMDVDVND